MLSLVELQFPEHSLLALALQLAVQLGSLGLQLTNPVPTYTGGAQQLVSNTEQTQMYYLQASAVTAWIIHSHWVDYLRVTAQLSVAACTDQPRNFGKKFSFPCHALYMQLHVYTLQHACVGVWKQLKP